MTVSPELAAAAIEFARVRGWERFHNPKNLAMALTVEAAELLECFQWLTAEESDSIKPEGLEPIADEIADVQIYLLMMANRLGMDIGKAVEAKMVKNGVKYPVGAQSKWEKD